MEIQQRAREAFELFLKDPSHRSLDFKRYGGSDDLYSARVNQQYRCLAQKVDGDHLVWFFIGTKNDLPKHL